MKYPRCCIVKVRDPKKAPWQWEEVKKTCYTTYGRCKVYYNEDLKKYYFFEAPKGRKSQEKCYEIISFCGEIEE